MCHHDSLAEISVCCICSQDQNVTALLIFRRGTDRLAYYGLRDNYAHLITVMELLVRNEDTSFDRDLSTSQCVCSTHL